MSKLNKNLQNETGALRQKIRRELCVIETNLSEYDATEIGKRSKALTDLFKLTETLDAHEVLQAQRQVAQALADDQDKFTPYDKIPPPSAAEMRAIRERIDRIYSRLRDTKDPEIRTGKPDSG